MNSLEKPLVSVICTTYNHEKYIAQTLDGLVMQRCCFSFEVIVHDDASTDKTQDIIREYVEKYPDLFVPVLQTKNQYSQGVDLSDLLYIQMAKGKYLALCEGDDYWTDPNKLQEQVDYMESNPDCGMVYGKAIYFEQERQKFTVIYGDDKNDFKSLLFKMPMMTLTLCMRKSIYEQYDGEHIDKTEWKMGDGPMIIYFSLHSRLHFIDQVYGVYRVLANSASHSSDHNKQYCFYLSSCDVAMFFLENYYSGSDKQQLAGQIILHRCWLLVSMAARHKCESYYTRLLEEVAEIKKLPASKKKKLLLMSSKNRILFNFLTFILRIKQKLC